MRVVLLFNLFLLRDNMYVGLVIVWVVSNNHEPSITLIVLYKKFKKLQILVKLLLVIIITIFML